MIQMELRADDLPEFARNPRRPGVFNQLQTAKLAGKLVEFLWPTQDIDCPLEARRVTVKFVVDWRGQSYIHGHCHKYGQPRTYSVSKMAWLPSRAKMQVIEGLVQGHLF